MLGSLGAGEAATAEVSEEAVGPSEDQPTMKALMLGGAILWFVAAPKWLREED